MCRSDPGPLPPAKRGAELAAFSSGNMKLRIFSSQAKGSSLSRTPALNRSLLSADLADIQCCAPWPKSKGTRQPRDPPGEKIFFVLTRRRGCGAGARACLARTRSNFKLPPVGAGGIARARERQLREKHAFDELGRETAHGEKPGRWAQDSFPIHSPSPRI